MTPEALKAFCDLLQEYVGGLPGLNEALGEMCVRLEEIKATLEAGPLMPAGEGVDPLPDVLVAIEEVLDDEAPPARAAAGALEKAALEARSDDFAHVNPDLGAAARELRSVLEGLAAGMAAAGTTLVEEGFVPLLPELTRSRESAASATAGAREILETLERESMALISGIADDVEQSAQAAADAARRALGDDAQLEAAAGAVAAAIGPESAAAQEILLSHGQVRDQLERVYDDHGARIQAAAGELGTGLRDLLEAAGGALRAGADALGGGLDAPQAEIDRIEAELGAWGYAARAAAESVDDLPQQAPELERARMFSEYAMELAEKMA